MKKNKMFSAMSLVLAAVMGLGLTACGNNPTTPTQQPTSNNTATNTPADTTVDTPADTTTDNTTATQSSGNDVSGELTIWIRSSEYLGLEGGSPDKPYYEYIKSEFPNLVVNEIQNRGWGELAAAIAADDTPDIYFWEGEAPMVFYDQIAQGFCEPLDDYINADPDYKNAFLPGILDTHKVDGATYGIPVDVMPITILCNLDVFDKRNVPYPTNDWTIDEFVEIAKALTNKSDPTNKTVGIARNIEEQDYTRLLNMFFQAYGVQGYKEVDGKKLSNLSEDPNAVTAIEKYLEVQGNNYACTFSQDERTELGLDNSIWDVDWSKGVAGMFAGASSWGIYFDDTTKEPIYNTAVYDVPQGPGGRGTYVTNLGMSLFAGSKNKDVAWSYMKAITGKAFRENAYTKNANGETIYPFRYDENTYRFGFGIPAFTVDSAKLTPSFKALYNGFSASAASSGITPVDPPTLVDVTKAVEKGEKQLVDALREYDNYVNENNRVNYR